MFGYSLVIHLLFHSHVTVNYQYFRKGSVIDVFGNITEGEIKYFTCFALIFHWFTVTDVKLYRSLSMSLFFPVWIFKLW